MTVAVAALAAVIASSAGALEVSLDVERCPSLARDHMFQLVALELDARVVTPDRAGEQTARVEVACAGADVQLKVSDRLTGKLPHANDDARRPRRAGRRPIDCHRRRGAGAHELDGVDAPRRFGSAAGRRCARRAGAAARRAGARPAPLPAPGGTGYVLAVGQALGPFDGVGVAWGGGLRFGWTPGGARVDDDVSIWRPGVDLELTAARNETSRGLGTVDVSMWSAALRVSLRLARGRSWFDVGAGGRAGVARLAGMPGDVTTTRGATLAGTWAGPIAYVGVGRRFWRLAVAAGVEGGTVLRAVSGLVDDGPSISVAGRWLSGTLAIGWGG